MSLQSLGHRIGNRACGKPHRNLLGHALVLSSASVLTILAIRWMGFDFSMMGRAYLTGGDFIQTDWAIYQGIYNLTHWPIKLGYSTIFWHDPASFAYTIAPYGISIFVLPIYFLTGQNLQLTGNIYFLLTFVLTAWTAYLLIRYLLSPSSTIATVAALMIAFAQFRFLHFGHIDTLSTQFFLLSLYALHRLIDTPSSFWVVFLGISSWLCFITSGYLGVIFAITAAVIVAFVFLHVDPERRWRILVRLIGAGACAVMLCGPFLAFRLHNETMSSGWSFDLSVMYSATIQSWFSGGSHIYKGAVPFAGEGSVFIGFVPLTLAALAWPTARAFDHAEPRSMTRRQVVELYSIVTLAGFVLSLGPVLQVGSIQAIPLPYILLMQMPVFSWIRCPARFILMAVLGTGVLSAYTLLIWAERQSRLTRAGGLLVISVLLLIELTPPRGDDTRNLLMSLRAKTPAANAPLRGFVVDKKAELYRWLAAQPKGTPVVHYPIFGASNNTIYLAYESIHNQPMLNGWGSWLPGWFSGTNWKAFPDQPTMRLVEERQIQYLLVHRDLLGQGEQAEFNRNLQVYALTHRPLEMVRSFGAVDVYRLPNTTRYEVGTLIKFGNGGDSERFRTSGWSKTEDQQTWTEGNSAVLNFSGLPPSQPLKLRITLLPFTKEPELPAQPIEVYANGKKVADWQVIGRSTYAASIPADAVSDTGALTLEFRIPKAASPQSLGISADSRQLGVAAFDLVIKKVS